MKKKKQAITEPKFVKIFCIRFLILLGILETISILLVVKLGSDINDRRRYNTNELTYSIKSLIESYCGNDDLRESYLNYIKMDLYLFSSMDYNYAEIRLDDLYLATDKDTARISIPDESGFASDDSYYIEDISYLEPAEEYLTEFRKQYILSSRYTNDPVLSIIYNSDSVIDKVHFFRPKTVYINREDHTFLPGIVVIENNAGDRFEVDCTPADTKGYELISYTDEPWEYVFIFRLDPDLTLDNAESTKIWDSVANSQNHQGTFSYTEFRERSVWDLAPLTSALILISGLILPLIISIVLSVIKYQREKTIWNIFRYRTMTTEAMAHDLKTPLAALQAYAEYLEYSPHDPEKVREYSGYISDKVASMDHMISDILVLSQSGSGKSEITIESVSLRSLLEESLDSFPQMKTEITGDDVTLSTDRKLFKQAVDNLLSNCDRYGEKDGTVDIEITPEALTVTNSTSLSYDDVDSLKQPFVKGDNTRGSKGTGLGLSIAENNLDILGYSLDLVSGKGTFKAIVRFGGKS